MLYVFILFSNQLPIIGCNLIGYLGYTSLTPSYNVAVIIIQPPHVIGLNCTITVYTQLQLRSVSCFSQ